MLTPEEKAALQAEIANFHPEESPNVVADQLNATDSDEWMVVPLDEQKVKLSKLALLTHLTPAQCAGIRMMLVDQSDSAQYFKMLYEADNEFWVNDATFRGMVDTLATELSIPAETVTAIKRLGERKKKISEKILGRAVTANDIREARV